MKNFYSLTLAVILSVFSAFNLSAQTNVSYANLYVDGSKGFSGDGRSWGSAYNDLNAALKYANETPGAFAIHVAAGNYKPNEKTLRGNPFTSDEIKKSTKNPIAIKDGISLTMAIIDVAAFDGVFLPEERTTVKNTLTTRDHAFAIKKSGIKLLGGYPAGGGTRNPAVNKTYLDGQLNGSEYAYHVVIIGRGEDNFFSTTQNDSVVVDGFTIQNAKANGSGSINASGYTTLRNNGGAMLMIFDPTSNATNRMAIRNCEFKNNTASAGGAVFNQSCRPTFDRCTFTSNSATSVGGAVINVESHPTFKNCSFVSNTATLFAGAIFASKGSCTDQFSRFVSNNSQVGGAIYNQRGTLNMNGTLFKSNTAKVGGAFQSEFGSITSNNVTYRSNSVNGTFSTVKFSEGIGGAIMLYRSSASFNGSVFASNTANNRGGAIWIRSQSGSGVSFNNCRIDSNSVSALNNLELGLGGAMLIDSLATPSFRNSTFSSNSAFRGGVYFAQLNTNPTFNLCSFNTNTAHYAGSVTYLEATVSGTMNDCSIVGNKAPGANQTGTDYGSAGAAIYVGNTNATMNIKNTLFQNNSSNHYVAGVMNLGNANIENCVFTGNTGHSGTSIFAGTQTTNVKSCTFYGNTATDDDYNTTVVVGQGADVHIYNSIVWDGNYCFWYDGIDVQYSNVQIPNQTYPGTGNINTWPGFANHSDPDGADNVWRSLDDGFGLTTSSGSINAGDNAKAAGINKDFTLNTRFNGTIDIGAYERQDVVNANTLRFADYTQNISIPHIERGSSYSFEARIKTNSGDNTAMNLVHWTNSGNGQETMLYTQSGKLFYKHYDGSQMTTVSNNSGGVSTSLNNGQWHHVAVAKDASGTVKLFADGVEIASGNAGNDNTTNTLHIGAGNELSRSFKGDMDEVRIWSKALCLAEIKHYMNCEMGATAGLEAYYAFNQGFSGVANVGITSLTDGSGNDRNGTLNSFDLAGNNNWMAANTGVSGTCGAYAGASVTASNNGPLETGSTLELSASQGYGSYSWSGPGGFVSTSQSPTIPNTGTQNAGTYSVSVLANGCEVVAETDAVINPGKGNVLALQNGQITMSHYTLGEVFTIETRFLATASSVQQPIITWSGSNSNEIAMYVNKDGKLVFFKQLQSKIKYQTGVSEVNLLDGAWHHIAVSRAIDGNTFGFVDGVQVFVFKDDLPVSTTSTTIGYRNGHGYAQGLMDEFRIWDRTRCAAEISASMDCAIDSNATNLVVYYNFNQGAAGENNASATTVLDRAGTAQNGTLSGFTLNGSTSNWIKATGDGIVSGTVCTSPTYPQMSDIKGNNVAIVSGSLTASKADGTDFGLVGANSTKTRTFSVENTGADTLTLSFLELGDSDNFVAPSATVKIAGNTTGTFDITFDPKGTTSKKSLVVWIFTNDCNKGFYAFTLSGTGVNLTPAASLHLDGNGDFATVDSYSLGDEFTMEAMVKTTSGQQMSVVTHKGDGFDVRSMTITNGYLGYAELGGASSGSVTSSTSKINDGNWHHIAVTRKDAASNNISLYVDGQLQKQGTVNTTATLHTLNVGTWGGISLFNGNIDEVRVWDRSLCPEEIAAQHNCEVATNSSGLVTYYQMNQGFSGHDNTDITTLEDATTSANHATITGVALYGSTSNFMADAGVVTGASCSAALIAEIDIKNNNGVSIANNDATPATADSTDFGSVDIEDEVVVHTFVIENTGTADLNLVNDPVVELTGDGFALISKPTNTIAGSGSTSFRIAFNPSVAAVSNGTVTVRSNDCDESVYTFSITGTGTGSAPTGEYLNLADNQYIELDGTTDIDFSTGDYTLEAHIRLDGSQTNYTGILVEPGTPGFQFVLVGDKVAVEFPGAATGTTTGVTDLNDGQWHQVAIVFDRTLNKFFLYADGELEAEGTAPTTAMTNSLQVRIGTDWTGQQKFNGDVDEVRIWNRIVCPSEQKSNMAKAIGPSAEELLAYYNFNQGQDAGDNTGKTTLKDQSGNKRHGTLTNFAMTGSASNYLAPGVVAGGAVAGPFIPAEAVMSGNDMEIAAGDATPSADDNTDFGQVQINGGSKTNTFVLRNIGAGKLALWGDPKVTVTGDDFSVSYDIDVDSIATGTESSFTITYTPSGTGTDIDTVVVSNNDCDESNYWFVVQGEGYVPDPSSAVHFDGVDDYMAVPSPFYAFGEEITVEWMVHVESGVLGSGMGQSTIGVDDGATNVWLMHYNGNGTMSFLVNPGNNGGAATTGTITDGWHHIVGVGSKEYTRIYVDSNLVGAGPGYSGDGITNNASSELHIGKDVRYNSGRFFTGSVDEVRIWSRVLCDDEIINNARCEITGNEANLVGYYQFNEGYGDAINSGNSTVTDHSTTNADGTLISMALTGTSSNLISTSEITNGDACDAFAVPVIAVSGNGNDISNGDVTTALSDQTEFGFGAVGDTISKTFTITNDGTLNDLLLTGISKVDVRGEAFSLRSDADSVIASGNSTTFTVDYHPEAEGIDSADVYIYNNSCGDEVFHFRIKASSVPADHLSFDSLLTSYVKTDNLDLDIRGEFTVELWAKPNSLQFSPLFTTRHPVDGGFDIQLTEDGNLHGDIGSGGCFCWITASADATVNYTPGEWFHVAYSVHETGYDIYYNGERVDGGTYSASNPVLLYNTNNAITLGSNRIVGDDFDGELDEVRVWDRALCKAEIVHNMNKELSTPQEGLVLYYNLNQGGAGIDNSGITQVLDQSGNDLHGEVVNHTLTDDASNWIVGSPVTSGDLAPVFILNEIEVLGNGVQLTDGQTAISTMDNTDFGQVLFAQGDTSARSFFVKNTGGSPLNLSGSPRVTVAGSGFTLLQDADAQINPGDSSEFVIKFAPNAIGAFNGTITIENDDCDEPSFTFGIEGDGKDPQPGNVLKFDGVNDYVEIADPFYEFGNAITVEWHVNAERTTMGSGIGQGSANVGSGMVWLMHFGWHKDLAFLVDGGGVGINGSLSEGWHHIVGVATKEYTKIYVDGELRGTGPGYRGSTVVNNENSVIHLGKDVRFSSGRFMRGSMDELRIWNRELMPQEIKAFATCERMTSSDYPKALVGYYQFNQGTEGEDNTSLTVLPDSSVTGSNGTLNNFALNGTVSNWMYADPITTGDYCTPCTPYSTDLTLEVCGLSYTSPSGRYEWTETGMYSDTMCTVMGCDSIINVDLTLNLVDPGLTVTPSVLGYCSPSGPLELTVEGAESGVSYVVADLSQLLAVSDVKVGEDSDMTFSIEEPASETTLHVLATAGACELLLDQEIEVVLSQTPQAKAVLEGQDLAATVNNVDYAWFNCTYEQLVEGETSSVFTSDGGSYALIATNDYGCVDTSACIDVPEPDYAEYLNFDGTDDYVAGTLSTLPQGMDARTIEVFFRTDDIFFTTMFNYGEFATNQRVGIQVGDGNLQIITELNDFNTFEVVNDGQWHHVAIVYGAGALTVYLDGLYVGGANVDYETNGTDFQIGAAMFGASPAEFFNGDIDEVRIWDRILEESEIIAQSSCELTGTEPGLIGYFNFNQGLNGADNTSITALENSATSANDDPLLSGFALNGAASNFLGGSPVGSIPDQPVTTDVVYELDSTATQLSALGEADLYWYTDSVGGVGSMTAPTPSTSVAGETVYYVASRNESGCESARTPLKVTVNPGEVVVTAATHLDFDGVDDVVSGTIAGLPQGNAARTVEMMFKTSDEMLNTLFWYGTDGPGTRFGLTVDGGWLVMVNGMDDVVDFNTVNDGNWNHVAVVHDGSDVSLYLNGSPLTAEPRTLTTSGTDFYIGGNPGFTFENFNGEIDEVRVWDIALDQGDILSNMYCELEGNEPGLVGYFQLNQGDAGADNTGETTAINEVTGAGNGTLSNFALNGTTSNWVDGSTVSGSCIITGEDGLYNTDDLIVYPVPSASGKLQFRKVVDSFVIITPEGKEVANGVNTNSIDLQHLPSGMYFVKVGNITKRVVINR